MKKVLWLTETAVMLALLICLQWAGSLIPHALTKQLVTGTLVNCVLAVTVLTVGYRSGLAVALISPLCAFLVGISQPITIFPIMLGNACYILLLKWLMGTSLSRKIAALAVGSVAKFGILYFLMVKVVCGLAYDALLGKEFLGTTLLNPKMPAMLTVMFSWPQLVTALTGGTVALLILPVLHKALKK